MSDSSFFGTIRKNYHSLMSIFSKTNSELEVPTAPRRRHNAFNVTANRRPKFHTILSHTDTVIKLISLYRQNECLWNPNCPDYKNAEYQENVWKKIAGAIDENIPVEQVKRKVHVLRNKWESNSNGLYLPKLFYYPYFEFLNSVSSEGERMDSGSEQTIVTPQVNTTIETSIISVESKLESSTDAETVQGVESDSDNSTKSRIGIRNKALHIHNLCEVIRIDLEQLTDELFFEAKWKILDVLRDTQLKEFTERAQHMAMAPDQNVGKANEVVIEVEETKEPDGNSTSL